MVQPSPDPAPGGTSQSHDVVIIGGGPSGSTLASFILKYRPQSRILILEKEKFPRDHVGESQLPAIGAILDDADGFIDVFDNDSTAYSYVAVEGSRVTDIAEKVVISRHATTGLYGFRSAAYYLEQAAATTGRSRGEFYVSDVYRQMLDTGADIRIDPCSRPAIVLGTPAEYEAWIAEHGA